MSYYIETSSLLPLLWITPYTKKLYDYLKKENVSDVYVQKDSVDEALGYFDSREIHDWEHSIIKRIEILRDRHEDTSTFNLNKYDVNDIVFSTLIGGRIDYPYQNYLNYVRGRGFLNSNLVYDLNGNNNSEIFEDLSNKIRSRYHELKTKLQELQNNGTITANFQVLQNYWGKYFLDDPDRDQAIKINLFDNNESYIDYIKRKYRESNNEKPFSRDDYHLEEAFKNKERILQAVPSHTDMKLIVCDGSYSAKPGNPVPKDERNQIIIKVETDFPYDINKTSDYFELNFIGHEIVSNEIYFDSGSIVCQTETHSLMISDRLGFFDVVNPIQYNAKNGEINYDLEKLIVSKNTAVAVHDDNRKRISQKLYLLGIQHYLNQRRIYFPQFVSILPVWNSSGYQNRCKISTKIKRTNLRMVLDKICLEVFDQNDNRTCTRSSSQSSVNRQDTYFMTDFELNDDEYIYGSHKIRIKATYSNKNNEEIALIGPCYSLQYISE